MRYLSPVVAAVLLAALNVVLYVTLDRPWSITTGESHLVAYIENLFFPEHVSSSLYFRKYIPELNWRVWLNFGIILGAFIGAYLGRDFKIRIPAAKSRFVQVFIGGVLMGYGARLALGCNVGHIMSGVPQMAVSSFLAFGAIAAGAYLGGRILLRLV
ncbi:MAG: YeeE/YedE family protein [Euryarchaeota archaeon]|nr:YeeE/YedE family protein [Euryarchaeota archaeon]